MVATTTDTVGYDTTTALLVIDVQNDFADSRGSLYVQGGEEVVPVANAHIDAARRADATVVATQDWHPPSTPHFVALGGQWPEHCVRQTWGAQLHPELDEDLDLILRKGTGGEDGYSAFTVADPESRATRATGLAAYLQARGITRVVMLGLALDVCVRASGEDAVALGFDTTVVVEGCRAVEMEEGDGQRTVAILQALGARCV